MLPYSLGPQDIGEAMHDARGRWWTIEHTGDLGIEVEAPSLPALFVMGACGMTGVLLGLEGDSPEPEPESAALSRELVLEAPDREALLVEWLRELLYIHASEGLLFTAAEMVELTDKELVARASFSSPEDEVSPERELKGVTYHDLELSRRGDGWFARIVFDL